MEKSKKLELTPAVIKWAHDYTDNALDEINEVLVGIGYVIISGSSRVSYETGGMSLDLSAYITEVDNNG